MPIPIDGEIDGGKRRRSAMLNIGQPHAQVKQKILDGLLNPVRPILTAAVVAGFCASSRYAWRERDMGPLLTLLACTYKQLETGKSARDVEKYLVQLGATAKTAQAAAEGSDGKTFCDARARLPIRLFQLALQFVGNFARSLGCDTWQGLQLVFIDGTTFKVPRTLANVKAFGLPRNQHGAGGLPVVRLVLMVCAGTGAVLDCAFGPNRLSELRLIVAVLLRLPRNRLVVGDALFGTYLNFGLLQYRGCHGLFFRQAARKTKPSKWLGTGDELQVWERPTKAGLFPHWLWRMPETMEIRMIRRKISRQGYRDYYLEICTTLLDPVQYPADELVAIYLKRWGIELDLRALKTAHGLDALTTKSPAVIVRELYSVLLAYNCVRAIMAQTGTPVRTLGYENARETVMRTCLLMSKAPTSSLPEEYRIMLALIRAGVILYQERPSEPRMIVNNKRRYPLLRVSRAKWRKTHAA